MNAALHTLMVVLFFYAAIGVACAGERLKNNPEAELRSTLMLVITWGKHFIKGLVQR